MLSQEQITQIKQQLISQAAKTMGEDDLEETKRYLDSLTPDQLEEFLKKNNLVQESNQKCIFCSIVFGDTTSYKIEENEKALAVLEINPISKGHTIIIPKNHSEEVPGDLDDFIKKISEIVKANFSPKKVLVSNQTLFGHAVVNLIPVYQSENLKSKRYSAKKEELEEVQKKLTSKPEVKEKKEVKLKKIVEKDTWLPKRIP